MFRKVLIANRGEIAIRIARTCRRLGIAVAGVHSDADRRSPHVAAIGDSILLGPAPAHASYLCVERVLEAARASGADAVHPGYGFLSENGAFAEAVESAGLAFVGPTPDVLRELGDKAAAKRLAADAEVPTIPGSPRASADAREIAAMAKALGLPVLLKAAAGGGGKGIRVIHGAASLDEDIASAMREGLHAFGDAALLVERYLPHGRHVEVQILGDGRGDVVHLWERECSLQRRHQKVIEEAPALALPASLRQAMLDAAVALGRRVRYRALGTVEFLVTGDAFHFLEVNPRLQVEHPVTEAVTGLDLVELQLRAAAGESLGFSQGDVRCSGHAVEARVYAEDAAHGFVPCTGTVRHVSWPPAPARVESGVQAESTVTSHYDPMLAKLVAHGADRARALERLRTALDATQLAGVTTNLDFLASLLRAPSVCAAVPDTGTVDDLLAAGMPAAPWRASAPHIAAAWTLRAGRAVDPAAPVASWPAFTQWRLGAPRGYRPLAPQFEVRTDAVTDAATLTIVAHGDTARMHFDAAIGDARHAVGFDDDHDGRGGTRVEVDGRAVLLWIGRDEHGVWLSDGRRTERVAVRPALERDPASGARTAATLVAPLTGKVLEVRVRDGDTVLAGQVLLVIESMKMEMRITAPHGGVATILGTAVGAMVERGAALARVEPVAPPAPGASTEGAPA